MKNKNNLNKDSKKISTSIMILFFSFALASVLVLSVFSDSANALEAPKVKIFLLNQDPDPVEPGQVVELRFKLQNDGGGSLSNVKVEVIPEFPFSLRPGDGANQSLGDIAGYQRGENIHTFNYKLLVDPEAVEGDHEISVIYRDSSGSGAKQTFNVSVRSSDSDIAVTKITTSPERLVPGKEGSLNIQVKNFNTLLVKDVKLKLDFTSELLPIAPIGSGSEQRVSVLKAGESATFNYKIIPYANADSKIYKIPARITFSDDSGKKFNKTETIAIVVGSEPELQITIDKTDILSSGKSGDVTIRLSNSGVSDVKFLTVSLKDTKSIKIIGANSKYVGGVDSDDFELVTFKIFINPDSESVVLPLDLQYSDENNQNYKKTANLDLPVYSSKELSDYGLVKSSSWIWIAAAIFVIVAAGFIMFRRKKK